MRVPVPQTNFNSLLEAINAYMRNDAQPGEFELKRLERDIQKVKDVSAVEGWKLGAMLGSVVWDPERVLHDSAVVLDLVPGDAGASILIGQCLWNVGLFPEAAEAAERAYTLAPNSARAVSAVMENSICLADYERAMSIKLAAQAMRVPITDDLPDLSGNVESLASMKIPLARVKAEALMALNVMANHRIRGHSVRSRTWVDPEAPESQFIHVFIFNGTLDQEVGLEKALAKELGDDPEWAPNRLSTEFMAQPYPQ